MRPFIRFAVLGVTIASATILGTGLASAVDWNGCEQAGGIVWTGDPHDPRNSPGSPVYFAICSCVGGTYGGLRVYGEGPRSGNQRVDCIY
jgi:hypothetical protein